MTFGRNFILLIKRHTSLFVLVPQGIRSLNHCVHTGLVLENVMHGSGSGNVAILRSSASMAGAVEPEACIGDALFAQFAQHSGNALWIADAATGRFQYLNPAAERLWATAITGLDQLSDRVHSQDRDRVMGQRARVVAGEVQRLSYRLCDGAAVRQFRETSFAMPADGISGPRVAGIAEDISASLPSYLIDCVGEESVTASALNEAGLSYKRFGPDEFLRVADNLLVGCVIVDLNGLANGHADYLRALRARAPAHSVVLVGVPDSTQSDIIGAMQAGAIDYLLYPPSAESVGTAIASAQGSRPPMGETQARVHDDNSDRLSRLPRREHEVLTGLMGGGTNKTIGRTLGISPRTVEAHRAHLMDRMNVRTLTDLIRVAIAAGFQPAAPTIAKVVTD